MEIQETLDYIGTQINDFKELKREYVSTDVLISIVERLYEVIDYLYKNPIERLSFQGSMKQKLQENINKYNDSTKEMVNMEDKEKAFM